MMTIAHSHNVLSRELFHWVYTVSLAWENVGTAAACWDILKSTTDISMDTQQQLRQVLSVLRKSATLKLLLQKKHVQWYAKL